MALIMQSRLQRPTIRLSWIMDTGMEDALGDYTRPDLPTQPHNSIQCGNPVKARRNNAIYGPETVDSPEVEGHEHEIV